MTLRGCSWPWRWWDSSLPHASSKNSHKMSSHDMHLSLLSLCLSISPISVSLLTSCHHFFVLHPTIMSCNKQHTQVNFMILPVFHCPSVSLYVSLSLSLPLSLSLSRSVSSPGYSLCCLPSCCWVTSATRRRPTEMTP